MPFNITEFQGNLPFGGARPSLFEVTMTNPINASADDRFANATHGNGSKATNDLRHSYPPDITLDWF